MTTVPFHGARDISPNLLRKIIEDIRLTPEAFLKFLCADVNEDGNLDLLAVDSNTFPNGVRLYLGDGTGHFA